MSTKSKSIPATVATLIVLLILLGLGGFVGGIPMLIDPSGASIGLPGNLLDNVPIDSFILPGLFLIVAMGIIPFIIAYGLWKHERWAWLGTLAQGVVLILWICFQFFLWGEPVAIQYIYLIWGIVILLLGLLPQTRQNLAESDNQ
jgi:hypothetical protein